MIVIALAALGLGLSRLPSASRWILLFSAGLALGPWFLARRGYRLTDIITVLAIVLLAMGLLLPAMVLARIQSGGRRTMPIRVPAYLARFWFGGR
jgi:hypothetical protein